METTILKDESIQVLNMTVEQVVGILERIGQIVADAARPLCAVKTGAMVKSLTSIVDKEELAVHIGYTVPYAYWVETGTQPHIIKPVKAKILYSREQDKFFGTEVHHPGAVAKPSLIPALEQSRTEIMRLFNIP